MSIKKNSSCIIFIFIEYRVFHVFYVFIIYLVLHGERIIKAKVSYARECRKADPGARHLTFV